MIKQVIFDCDGVLVDTEIIAAEIMVDLLSDLSIQIDIHQYIQEFTGKTFSDIMQYFNVNSIPGKDIESLAKQSEHAIYDRLREIPGMPELVQSLDLPVAVASNSNLWQVKKALQFLQLEDTIGKAFFSAEMVASPKPSPDVYLLAAEKTGQAPAQCLVVEDSTSGVRSALSAGMEVIGFCGASHILPGHAEKLAELGASSIAHDATELKSILSSRL